MRINIITKFELYEKLTELVSKLTEHEESATICKQAIHDLKSNFSEQKLNLYLEHLNQYSWIQDVDSFMNEYTTFLQENKYSIELEKIGNKLKPIDAFQPIVESITSLITLNESELKTKISELSKFKYEPNVKSFLNKFQTTEFKIQETEKAKVINSPITPVYETAQGLVFSTNTGNYIMNKSKTEISKFTGTTSKEFQFGKSVLEFFKYKGNNIFEANTKSANIKVIAGDTNKMFINESEIQDKQALRKLLTKTNLFNVSDTKTHSMIEFMYERANTFLEVDFVKSVETVKENFEIFKLDNNDVYIAKLDKTRRNFILEHLDNNDLDDLTESLQKEYKMDFSIILESLEVNRDSIKFASLVESLDLQEIKDVTKQVNFMKKVDEAYESYSLLDYKTKQKVQPVFLKLDKIQSVLESEQVNFLLKIKQGLLEKLDEGSELKESLQMINSEIEKCISI
jgi:hypothetical protein